MVSRANCTLQSALKVPYFTNQSVVLFERHHRTTAHNYLGLHLNSPSPRALNQIRPELNVLNVSDTHLAPPFDRQWVRRPHFSLTSTLGSRWVKHRLLDHLLPHRVRFWTSFASPHRGCNPYFENGFCIQAPWQLAANSARPCCRPNFPASVGNLCS